MTSIEQELTAAHVVATLPGAVTVRAEPIDAGPGQVVVESDDDQVSVVPGGDAVHIKSTHKRGSMAEYAVTVRSAQPVALSVAGHTADVTSEIALGALDLAGKTVRARVQTVAAVKIVGGNGDVEIGELLGRGFFGAAAVDVSIDHSDGGIDVRSGAGSLRVGELGGPLSVRSATGSVDVERAGDDIEIRSGAGRVSIGVLPSLPAWLDLRSGMGAVDIDVPPREAPADDDPYITVSVTTGKGDVLIYQADEVEADEDEADEAEADDAVGAAGEDTSAELDKSDEASGNEDDEEKDDGEPIDS